MKKIGFVGGPMSGKTSLIRLLQEELTNKGYKVIEIEEIPTQLMHMNLIPDKTISRLDFQKECMTMYFTKYLNLKYFDEYYYKWDKDYDKYIILYDTLPGCGYGYLEDEKDKEDLDRLYHRLLNESSTHMSDKDYNLDLLVFCDTIKPKNNNFKEGNDIRVENNDSAIKKISDYIKESYAEDIDIELEDIGLNNRGLKLLKEIEKLYE